MTKHIRLSVLLSLRVQSTTRKTDRAKLQVSTEKIKLRSELGEIILSAAGEEPEEMVHAPATLLLTSAVKASGGGEWRFRFHVQQAGLGGVWGRAVRIQNRVSVRSPSSSCNGLACWWWYFGPKYNNSSTLRSRSPTYFPSLSLLQNLAGENAPVPRASQGRRAQRSRSQETYWQRHHGDIDASRPTEHVSSTVPICGSGGFGAWRIRSSFLWFF